MGLSRAQPPRRPHLKRCGPVPPRGRQRAEPGSHRPRCGAAPERRGGCGIPHGAAVLPASPGTGGQPLSYLRTALLRASRSATCRAPGPPRGPAAAPSRAALLLPSSSSSSLPQGLHGHRGPPTHRRPLRASPRRARAPLPSARPAPHPPPALASPPGPQEGRARAGSARAIGSGGAAGAGRERQRPLLCSARLCSALLGSALRGAVRLQQRRRAPSPRRSAAASPLPERPHGHQNRQGGVQGGVQPRQGRCHRGELVGAPRCRHLLDGHRCSSVPRLLFPLSPGMFFGIPSSPSPLLPSQRLTFKYHLPSLFPFPKGDV